MDTLNNICLFCDGSFKRRKIENKKYSWKTRYCDVGCYVQSAEFKDMSKSQQRRKAIQDNFPKGMGDILDESGSSG